MAGKTILIVDDELDMRIFLSTLLETSGYMPVVTRNGMEGIRKAQENPPDLIILDVMMPGEGGARMYRQLRTDENLMEIPVVMLSAVARATFLHYLTMLNMRLGGGIRPPDAYLEKPLDHEELLRTIKKIIE